jgi:predicted NAD/FAD-binding protein
VEVLLRDGTAEQFDHCVIGAHSDQALAMLADPTDNEKAVLGAIPYQENITVLHSDASMMPRHRSCWAAWNAYVPEQTHHAVMLTYNMNILQSLHAPVDFCVTLNRQHAIAPGRIVRELSYHHPVYTAGGFAAQKRFHEISGINKTHFCGAYWGYGFHEDGVKSALAACEFFGKSL